MDIVLVASEALPFVKSGGMGDVVGALLKYLPAYGFRVKLFLPAYRNILDDSSFEEDRTIDFSFGDRMTRAKFYKCRQEDRVIIAVDGESLFDREKLYGYFDDIRRFTFFSRAVFEYIVRFQDEKCVLHCHDWQSAILCAYVKMYWPSILHKPDKVIFTIHNLAYQGIGSGDLFRLVNLPGQFFTHEYLEFFGNINLIKAGLIFSDCLTTVSPTYAREITTPEFGEGLDGLIRALSIRKRIIGIVNGIDVETYDPNRDPCLDFPFSADEKQGKAKNRLQLLERYFPRDLQENRSFPVLSFISRFVEQKGLDLILRDPARYFSLPARWVFLGVGEAVYEKTLLDLEKQYPSIKVILKFDDRTARFLYGASDLHLLPSRFEPCGISQMIAMRYGALPLVRKVGGLLDTVIDYPFNPSLNTGFFFETYRTEDLFYALERALHIYTGWQDLWTTMMNNAMCSDFSWENPVRNYVDVYLRGSSP
ncbi:MAG TPA: glycogen/starch synthase [Atribacteraceae bacterium]|nr:glycogen/starch synthase [Atribacteraceae bacterium]